MQLLLFSNSTNAGEGYLEYTLPYIRSFLGSTNKNVVFIPFAGISLGFDRYHMMVEEKLNSIGIFTKSIHRTTDKVKSIYAAEAIIVGGGNTFCLLKTLQHEKLIETIRQSVNKGIPYIGWSAGANLACPTIMTTNDMPIVQPDNFKALNLIPFQINPHFTDFQQPGHAGETRETRINEFLLMNRQVYVAGLREGTLFIIKEGKINLLGQRPCRIFKYGDEPFEKLPGENFDFLMQ